jgi:acyl-CoA reductase-like NAD-dependent aldehyde dehydrogenase
MKSAHVSGGVQVMDGAAVDGAVAKAREVAVEWSAYSTRDRRRHLLLVRDAVADNGRRLAELDAAETGKSLAAAWLEVISALTCIAWSAKVAPRKLRSESVSTGPFVLKAAERHYEPLGVVGVIAPWNYPVAIPMQSIPNALAAGNTVVLKSSEHTPRVGQLLAQVVNSAGLDLVQPVAGNGETGRALVRSGVDKLVFTGSTTTGRQVLLEAAQAMTPVVMELGGNDPMVVWSDANLRDAARSAAGAAFLNGGQTCMAVQRVIVCRTVHDRFVDELVDAAKAMTADSAWGAPLMRPSQADVLQRRLAAAQANGARILAGGHRTTDNGLVGFEPTVVVDVRPHTELFQEESFGPVISVVRADDEQHAVTLANQTPYGLGASVFSRNKARARRLAAGISAGTVDINDAIFGAGIPGVAFGGTKGSGQGRLKGVEGLREFTRTKTVIRSRLRWTPSLAAKLLFGAPPTPSVFAALAQFFWTSPRRQLRRRGHQSPMEVRP